MVETSGEKPRFVSRGCPHTSATWHSHNLGGIAGAPSIEPPAARDRCVMAWKVLAERRLSGGVNVEILDQSFHEWGGKGDGRWAELASLDEGDRESNWQRTEGGRMTGSPRTASARADFRVRALGLGLYVPQLCISPIFCYTTHMTQMAGTRTKVEWVYEKSKQRQASPPTYWDH